MSSKRLVGRLFLSALVSVSPALAQSSSVSGNAQAVPKHSTAEEPSFTKKPTSSNLVDLIRQAKVVNPDYPVHAVVSGNYATVLTRRHPRAKEEDMKIDAVLITKSVLDAYGYCLDGVRVLFRDEDGTNGRKIAVTEQDIKNYGAGTMEPQQFLSSLKLVSIDGDLDGDSTGLTRGNESNLVVSPGPYEDQRLMLLDRINSLRKRGTGVAPYEKLFVTMDDAAKTAPSSEVKLLVSRLAEKLKEQEQLCRQAEMVSRGQGVKGTVSTPASSPSNEAKLKDNLRAIGFDGSKLAEFLGSEIKQLQDHNVNVSALNSELAACQSLLSRDPASGIKALRELKMKVHAAASEAMRKSQNQGGSNRPPGFGPNGGQNGGPNAGPNGGSGFAPGGGPPFGPPPGGFPGNQNGYPPGGGD
ncbi:MAG: hypothetical protein LCH63_09450 [Candidatus Melainabacteria bacterium]|nr:hypothetical protein [Candidatus Melainabacteria bacterium]